MKTSGHFPNATPSIRGTDQLKRVVRWLIVTVMPALAAVSTADAATFTALGDLPGLGFYSQALGVSDTGNVVVGSSVGASGQEAFYWTPGTGMVRLADLTSGGLTLREAAGVSSDGTVVAGTLGFSEAYRWSSVSGTAVGLGQNSSAQGVSADGNTIVGQQGANEAYRWTSGTGRVGLGDLPDGDFLSTATGVSGDGSVVVGYGTPAFLQVEAFRWTAGTGMQGLGTLFGGKSFANDVSRDGNVIVGISDDVMAFRWTSATGMQGLGIADGYVMSTAIALSADGSVIGGSMVDGATWSDNAVIWTSAESGPQLLLDVLLASGTTGLTGWHLDAVTGISGDGTKLVGYGHNAAGQTEAFLVNLATVPLPAATWLFGGALLGLASLKRRRIAP